MESDELIKIIKTTGILFEKKEKNHLIFISIVKKEKVFKNKQRMVDLSSFLEKSMYFKGNLVLQVPFLPSKTLMFYQMTLKIKKNNAGG